MIGKERLVELKMDIRIGSDNMKKYIGKYRVDIERDTDGEPVENGELYLRCVGRNRGGTVYRWDDETLVVYVPSSVGKANNMIEDMNESGVEILFKREYYGEADIHIRESDLDKVAETIGLTSFGAYIQPTSIRNHPKRDEIRQEKRDNMSDEEKEKMRLLGERLKSFRKNDNN